MIVNFGPFELTTLGLLIGDGARTSDLVAWYKAFHKRALEEQLEYTGADFLSAVDGLKARISPQASDMTGDSTLELHLTDLLLHTAPTQLPYHA